MAGKQVRLVVRLLWVRVIAKLNQEASRSEKVRLPSGGCRSQGGLAVIMHRWLRATSTAKPRKQSMDARGKVRFMGPPVVSESPIVADSIARNAEDVTVSFGEFCGMREGNYYFLPRRMQRNLHGLSASSAPLR